MTQEEKDRQRRERKERAVKEREQQVRTERSKVDAEIDKSRQGLNKGEGELEFKCVTYFYVLGFQIRGATNILLSLSYRTMLVDAIRDPQVRHRSKNNQILIFSYLFR